MKYDDYLTYSYEFQSSASQGVGFYYADGLTEFVPFETIFPEDDLNGDTILDLTIEYILYTSTNYSNRNYNKSLYAVSFSNGATSWLAQEYLFLTNRSDFVRFTGQSPSNSSWGIVSYYFDDSDNLEELGDTIAGNYDTTDYSYYRTTELDGFNYSLGGENYPYSIFDYNRVDYGADSGLFSVRGENTTYLKNYFKISHSGTTSSLANYLRFSLGNYYQHIYQSGYDAGYQNGNAEGYVNGYDTGYRNGVTTATPSNTTDSAFNMIGKSFEAVGSVLSLEIMPNITLGLCFSIPLIFVLIMTIFKLIRK